LTPSVSKGFYSGCEDIGATHKFVVYSGHEQYSMGKGITAIPLIELMQELKKINS
jgi:hypothetical protein